MKICIVGISGKLGQYMLQYCLERGYDVVGVCRHQSVEKLAAYKGRIKIIPGFTNDREVIKKAVEGCDGVLTVLVPWGVDNYSSGTAKAVLDLTDPATRLVFSCGWHISKDGQDAYSRWFLLLLKVGGRAARMLRLFDINDQVEACRMIFSSERNWTVVRGSDLEEGESEGLPVWSKHVGDFVLRSNHTRRRDFAQFMVHALTDDTLIHEAPAIVSCQSRSASVYSSQSGA
ncbi:NAD(P)-dependent oxidoreductase [Nitrosomonas marina]|uniref:NAD(P)H-binding n=1 Tax=Nitrosomonas marina TaxID=917 RepID=A0A1H8AL75_9PROT|nr:NAD(P)H-binding protein [Nitrosomonas marina]SEM71256.1 NAD(P)H-binding [Nitrosomonas marina]